MFYRGVVPLLSFSLQAGIHDKTAKRLNIFVHIPSFSYGFYNKVLSRILFIYSRVRVLTEDYITWYQTFLWRLTAAFIIKPNPSSIDTIIVLP